MRNWIWGAALLALLVCAGSASADVSVSFTTSEVKAAMAAQGAPLSDGTNQWGLWAVRAMPIVGGNGLYTITGGTTSQAGWGVSAPNGAFGAAPYTPTNSVWFWDASGAEVAGLASNPLYMMMDMSADTFWSSSFNGSGVWVGNWSPGAGGTFYSSGYDGGAGGTNVVTAVADAAAFSFSFALDAGATWDGHWQFVVDGSKYTSGSYANPGSWIGNFWGGYGAGPGGGLTGNMGAGYQMVIPLPGAALLGIVGLGCVLRVRRRFS